MNRDEQSDKNLDLAAALFVGLLDQPVERWPEPGALIVAMPANDPELSAANAEALAEMQDRHPEMVNVEQIDVIGLTNAVPRT